LGIDFDTESAIFDNNQHIFGNFNTDLKPNADFYWQNRHMSKAVRTKATQLDDVAKSIIQQLQIDGRRSYSEIGKVIGLSEAAVRQRVQKLTESGVMQVVAVTDPLQMGFNRQAMIGIRTSGDSRSLVQLLTEMPEVDYVVLTAGSFDILVEVVCENDDELIELLHSKIRTLPGVVETETFVYLKLHKQLYNWGTR
jgi:Lrp/AsnC family transcriptional regulator for asnA, asnC and gidA